MSLHRKVRVKKLQPRTVLQVLLENDIDASEYESLTTEVQIAAGVEANEADEYHLQNALKGIGASTDNEIPVPPPQKSDVEYESLYPRPFIEPKNYIKFSETVEETLGSLYDMTTEDDEFLKSHNAKKSAAQHLPEEDFERIMEFFEQTASEQAPYAAVDNTVISYEVMAHHMAHSPVNKLQNHTKPVYEYWKNRRHVNSNKPLHPSLKFETHSEQDDLDPYVCFRRREVRQTRKTRQRDVLVADKLKKLRKELEDGRQLVVMSQQREMLKRELLNTERLLFEHRAKLKERKVRLGIKTDEEDLYNTKPQKRKIQEVQPAVRAGQHTQLRLAVGKPVEQELPLLSDKLEERQEELRQDLENKSQTHKIWNQKHIDLTDKPLPPVKEEQEPSFRPAKPQFLPTPPASASDDMELDEEPINALTASKAAFAVTQHGTRERTPDDENTFSFRCRRGRGGRLYIDRRRTSRRDAISRLASPPSDADLDAARRFDREKYDSDGSDDEQPCYMVDPYDMRPLKFRASIPPIPAPNHQRYARQLPEGNGAAHTAVATRKAIPQQAQSSQGQGQVPQQPQQPRPSSSS
ncbi:enhancer of polycomb-like-domain-containing protein [Xylariales sp. AK1849]|nr:enhancer of polycomb-like-domain-containing protein [Xylariales sp. AK1849]